MNTTLTAVIEREDDLYVALCPEFDVARRREILPLYVRVLTGVTPRGEEEP